MKSVAAVVCLGMLVSGCGDLRSVASSLDERTEPTHLFWARLQGIQLQQFAEAQRELESVLDPDVEYDVDGKAERIGRVSDKHAAMADRMAGLDASNVDDEAVAFRDRLVQLHRSLAAEYGRFSRATKDRDFATVQSVTPRLADLLREFVAVWNNRHQVMSRLQERYARDFNVME